MWKEKRNYKDKKNKKYNNRLYIVIAIVFLLSITLSVRLYIVQVKNHDYYKSLASGQHNLQTKLEPERGDIFMVSNNDKNLYTVATNKDFASLFFIPKESKNNEYLAESIYSAINHDEVVLESKEELDKEYEEKLNSEIDYIKSLDIGDQEKREKVENTVSFYKNRKNDKSFKEARQIDLDLKIEEKRDKIIDSYLKKLRKYNDPYEPIENKLEEKDILNVYRYLASSSDKPLSKDELEIKNFKVYLKQGLDKELFPDLEISDKGRISFPGLSYQIEKHRYYPEKNIVSQISGFVRKEDGVLKGYYGLEEFFNKELYGSKGSISGQKGSDGSVVLNDREYTKPEKGIDLILTIDRPVQFRVCQELEEAVDNYKADGGVVIVLNPKSGAILAMCSYPNYDANQYNEVDDISVYNNPAVFEQYEPGSTFKTMTMAIALNENKIVPSTTYKDEGEIMIEGWHKPIRNADFYTHGPHGVVDMNTALAKSLNTGAIFAMKQVGPKTLAEGLKDFGFGQKTGIELGSESKGDIGNLLEDRVKHIDAATASFGQGIAVSPLQLALAYGAIANDGVLMKPYLVKEMHFDDGNIEKTQDRIIRRVISKKSADLVSAMLVNVIESGHAKKAGVEGYYIGGKTGTAQVSYQGGYSEDSFIHNFVGIAPIDNPKFVVLTKLNNPKTVRYSADSAAPLFGKITDFLLKYYGIPQER